MADYTVVNLRDVEDMAPSHGMGDIESRFARRALALEKSGLSYFKLGPGYRLPFGHKHGEQEEVYLVVSGSLRIKLDDEVIDLAEFDAVRVPGSVARAMEAGPSGAEVLAFGAPNTENKDAEIIPDFW